MQTRAWTTWMGGLAIAAAACGTTGWAEGPARTATITLRVYDYVQSKDAALKQAEAEASAILATGGVSARWVDCPTSHAVLKDFPDCQSALQVTDYVVSILPAAMADRLEHSEDALGSANESAAGFGRAQIFYGKIRMMTGGDTAPFSALLGRVMAHEIGHLLLGDNAHSRTGIMQAAWSDRELGMRAGAEMVFTEKQSHRIETRLAAESRDTDMYLAAANAGQP
ncbi:MAG: hypothetical protein ABSE53_16330 [Terracidiphilus sp.]|jgi:hypothetical protein